MTSLEIALKSALAVLRKAGRQVALVGGLAVSVRTQPRFTRDLDLAVVVRDDLDAEALVREFVLAGYGIRALVEQDSARRLATARLSSPRTGVVADLLFASSGIEAEIVQDAESIEVFPGISLNVATVPHLLAMKILARDDRRRPQDRMDIVSLLSVASPSDIQAAKFALGLVEVRGFSRDRDLSQAFAEALALVD